MKRRLHIFFAALTVHTLAAVQGAEPGASPTKAQPSFSKAATPALNLAESDRVSARPELVITTLGFGSCARQERPQPIWDTINAAHCDAFVLGGDNIYGDSPDPAVLRAKYAMLAAMPGFARLRQTTPLFATWDDHDYGINDGGAGFSGAAAAQQEFCDFFQVPATSPRRTTPGVYECVTLGPVGPVPST